MPPNKRVYHAPLCVYLEDLVNGCQSAVHMSQRIYVEGGNDKVIEKILFVNAPISFQKRSQVLVRSYFVLVYVESPFAYELLRWKRTAQIVKSSLAVKHNSLRHVARPGNNPGIEESPILCEEVHSILLQINGKHLRPLFVYGETREQKESPWTPTGTPDSAHELSVLIIFLDLPLVPISNPEVSFFVNNELIDSTRFLLQHVFLLQLEGFLESLIASHGWLFGVEDMRITNETLYLRTEWVKK